MGNDELGLTGRLLDLQIQIGEFVGEGDLSVVYKGHHLGLDAPVAVKVLNLPMTLEPALVASFVKRFVEGSSLHYRLSAGHLHIARSITSGHVQLADGRADAPYLVREWLEGRSLALDFSARRAEGDNGRTLTEVVELFGPVASALGYAHKQGVIHGRINPANLFLTDGRLKVLDFGIALAMHDNQRDIEHRRGSNELQLFYPSYAAPEQYEWEHGEVGPWTDVYGLAIVVLEALRDRPAIAVRATVDCIQKVCDRSQRPTPRSLAISVSREVEAVMTKAVALKASDRYKDAVEFWEALERAASPKVKTAGASGAHPRAQAGYRAPMPTRLGMGPVAAARPLSVPPPPPIALATSRPPAEAPAAPSVSPPAAEPSAPAPARASAQPPAMASAQPPAMASARPPGLQPALALVTSRTARPPALALLTPRAAPPPPPSPALAPVAAPAPEPLAPSPSPPPSPVAAAESPMPPPARVVTQRPAAPPVAAAPALAVAEPLSPMRAQVSTEPLALSPAHVPRQPVAPYPSEGSVWTTPNEPAVKAPSPTPSRRTRPRPTRRSDRGALAAFAAAGAMLALLALVGAHAIAARESSGDSSAARFASAVTLPSAIPLPPPLSEPPAPPEEPVPFDWKAARAALDETQPAMRECRHPGGRRGRGLLRVTFAPDGSVLSVNAVGDFALTRDGACVASHAKEAHTAPFRGGPRTMIYTFTL